MPVAPIQSMLTCITALKVYLKDHEEEEVGIGEPPELLKEVTWQEGENVVFGGLDGIVLKQKVTHERDCRSTYPLNAPRKFLFLYSQHSCKTG